MQINFFNSSNMLIFWGYVEMLLKGISPGIMLVTGTVAVGFLVVIIIKAFKKTDDEEENDDEIEVRHYWLITSFASFNKI